MALRTLLRWKIVLPCLSLVLSPVVVAAWLGLFATASFQQWLLYLLILLVFAMLVAVCLSPGVEHRRTAHNPLSATSQKTRSVLSPQAIETLSVEIEKNLTSLRKLHTERSQRPPLWQQITDTAITGHQSTDRMADSLTISQTQLCALEQLTLSSKPAFARLQNTLPGFVQQTAINTTTFASSKDGLQRELGQLEQTVTGMSKLYETTTAAARSVHQLGQQAEAITQIQNLVNDFAEQTGLLAINASALAAQAGEQGQGFSVLAQKVRSLSDRISEATEATSDIVDELQLAAQQTYHLMQQSTDAAQHQSQNVSDVYGALKRLEETFDRFDQTSTCLSEQIQPLPGALHQLNRLEQQLAETLVLLKEGFHLQAQELLEVEQLFHQTDRLATTEKTAQSSIEQTLEPLALTLAQLHQTLLEPDTPVGASPSPKAASTAEVL